MTREEWTKRFAAHIVSRAGWDEKSARECADTAAQENFQCNGDEWLDPEDDADVEMSYWDDDGGGA